MIAPAQSGRPSVGTFRHIAYRFNGEWVGILRNRQAKGAGRPPLAPLSQQPCSAQSGICSGKQLNVFRMPSRSLRTFIAPLVFVRSKGAVSARARPRCGSSSCAAASYYHRSHCIWRFRIGAL